MRITTLNLRGFFDWETRVDAVISYLDGAAPDVILFQEVVYLPETSPVTQPDLLQRALAAAGRAFPCRHSAVTRLQTGIDGGPYREGLSVLSRYPVTSSEALVLRHEVNDPHNRMVQFVDLDVDGTAWKLANVHLSIRDEYAVHHLAEVLGILDARGEQRIIGGDFNVNHLERRASMWRGRYQLSSEVEEYVSYGKSGQANDYFLVPVTHRIVDLALSDDGLSDHRALTVDLQ